MDQLAQILQAVQETNRKLASLDDKVSRLDSKVGGLDDKVSRLETAVTDLGKRTAALEGNVSGIAEQVVGLLEWRTEKDQHDGRVLNLLLDTRDRVERLESGFSEVKEWKAETLNKLDGFLVVVNRHESEIAALRGGQQRIEERLGKG